MICIVHISSIIDAELLSEFVITELTTDHTHGQKGRLYCVGTLYCPLYFTEFVRQFEGVLISIQAMTTSCN